MLDEVLARKIDDPALDLGDSDVVDVVRYLEIGKSMTKLFQILNEKRFWSHSCINPRNLMYHNMQQQSQLFYTDRQSSTGASY